MPVFSFCGLWQIALAEVSRSLEVQVMAQVKKMAEQNPSSDREAGWWTHHVEVSTPEFRPTPTLSPRCRCYETLFGQAAPWPKAQEVLRRLGPPYIRDQISTRSASVFVQIGTCKNCSLPVSK